MKKTCINYFNYSIFANMYALNNSVRVLAQFGWVEPSVLDSKNYIKTGFDFQNQPLGLGFKLDLVLDFHFKSGYGFIVEGLNLITPSSWELCLKKLVRSRNVATITNNKCPEVQHFAILVSSSLTKD
jgi:hypothetical protein